MEENLPVGAGILVLFVNVKVSFAVPELHYIVFVLVLLLQVFRAGCCWSYLLV